MSMDLLAKKVEAATKIPEGMREADPETLTIFLNDWETALRHLSRQVEAVRTLRDRAEARKHAWPLSP